jgi:hypothetical protein
MLYFYESDKAAEVRVNAFIEEAKELRRSKNVSWEPIFRLPNLPKLSSLFANWKPENKTAVVNQG